MAPLRGKIYTSMGRWMKILFKSLINWSNASSKIDQIKYYSLARSTDQKLDQKGLTDQKLDAILDAMASGF